MKSKSELDAELLRRFVTAVTILVKDHVIPERYEPYLIDLLEEYYQPELDLKG